MLQGRIPYRIYTCIDGEKTEEKVYERFKYALDTALNIHSIYLAAFAQVFPEEFDRAKAKIDKDPQEPSRTQKILSDKLGGKVLIVGGDDMESKDDVLGKPFLEGLRLR